MKDASLRPLSMKRLDRSGDSTVQQPPSATPAPAAEAPPTPRGDRLARGAKAGAVASALYSLPIVALGVGELRTAKSVVDVAKTVGVTGLVVAGMAVPLALAGVVGSSVATSKYRSLNTLQGFAAGGAVGFGTGMAVAIAVAAAKKSASVHSLALFVLGGVAAGTVGGAAGGFWGRK